MEIHSIELFRLFRRSAHTGIYTAYSSDTAAKQYQNELHKCTCATETFKQHDAYEEYCQIDKDTYAQTDQQAVPMSALGSCKACGKTSCTQSNDRHA